MINENIKMKKTVLRKKNHSVAAGKINCLSALVLLVAFVFSIGIVPLQAQQKNLLTVNASQIKAKVEPTMWGVFFEDINLGADGGIYAELVKNRSFEFAKPMMGWTVLPRQVPEGTMQVLNRQEDNISNPRYLRVSPNNATKGSLS